MRIGLGFFLFTVSGCTAESASVAKITLPELYPPVRAATPTALITDPQYAEVIAPLTVAARSAADGSRQTFAEPMNLALAVQERFYSGGPTALLRIVKDLDDRVQGLAVNPAKHTCLTSTPVASTYTLPSGQTFDVKLQCIENFGGGWVAFGFDNASTADAGIVRASEGNDFYLVEGQLGGNGGVYHVAGDSGSIEGWMAVANGPTGMGSQVVMHLLMDKIAGTLELALAGTGVGFCGAHLKTNPDYLFIQGTTNGAAPPGTAVAAGTQYCDAVRSGCFAAAALQTDLGSGSPSCASLAPSSFGISLELDASGAAGTNVTPSTIYTYFSRAPVGVPAF